MAKMYFPQYARGRDGVDIRVGESILAHIKKLGGIEIDSECGGRGVCGKDAIRIEQGSEFLSKPTQIEKEFLFEGELPKGQRLACQTRIIQDIEDIRVFIPDFGKYTILTDIVETHTELNPCVCRKDNRVVYGTGEDQGPYLGKILGLAIDVGTTTLVMQVVDLQTGENVGKPMASKNPQIAYGNDVISRIGYARDYDNGLGEMQAAVIDAVNKSLAEIEAQHNLERGHVTEHIYDVVAVGNSTMRSVFFGQNVHDLGVIPFEPSSKAALTRRAKSLGIEVHPQAMAYGPPLIGGHAGADCVADIIATRLVRQRRDHDDH